LSVYIQACRCVPLEVEAWEKVSRLQLSRGLREEAVNTLLKGQRFFRGRALREKAIRLLRRAWEVVPWHFEVTLELARLLAKNKDKDEALRLLRGLAGREEGRNLRRIRGAIMRISPTPASAWQWLRLRKG
ncbi:MAG: tetratricopeptide repeat protein, partial [Thermodesulfobacteriota bacterium]